MKDFNLNTINNDEWLTPPEIIRSLGEFDLDPCSPVNRPWDTAKNHFTINDNGLLQDWFGRIWLNPPYGRALEAWLNKMAMHNNGIALIFARTETKAFHNYVFQCAHSMFFIKGRIQFYDILGRKHFNANAPSALVAYNEYNSEMIENSKIKGFHAILRPQLLLIGIYPSEKRSWKLIVNEALQELNSEASLESIYNIVLRIAPGKVRKNRFYKEKIRQILQYHFNNVKRGIWEQ